MRYDKEQRALSLSRERVAPILWEYWRWSRLLAQHVWVGREWAPTWTGGSGRSRKIQRPK